MKRPEPRIIHQFGMTCYPSTFADGTWIESEEAAYPNGGYTRRAYALCEDGKRRVIACTIPDTYFSIPAFVYIRGKRCVGYLYIDTDTGTLKFHQYKGQ